ncbi:MAG TPA: phage GP46 family protein [Kofleriaceae bacterium]|nr:phage GP46 family protein [Kofleriaceae bacterium]
MPWDYLIDPVTRDLVKDGKGGFVKVRSAQTSVMNQLLAHRGEWWGDPELGSRLHDLRAMQARPEVIAPEEARLALERLVRAGRIADIEARAESSPGRVVVATRFRDTTSGSLVEMKLKPGG